MLKTFFVHRIENKPANHISYFVLKIAWGKLISWYNYMGKLISWYNYICMIKLDILIIPISFDFYLCSRNNTSGSMMLQKST